MIQLTNNSNYEKNASDIREKIKNTFIDTQNLIIHDFFDTEFNNIKNLEQLEKFRRKLSKFENIIGKTSSYSYFDEYYMDTMNKLEHKSNILENGGIETALQVESSPLIRILNKIKKFFSSKNTRTNI